MSITNHKCIFQYPNEYDQQYCTIPTIENKNVQSILAHFHKTTNSVSVFVISLFIFTNEYEYERPFNNSIMKGRLMFDPLIQDER